MAAVTIMLKVGAWCWVCVWKLFYARVLHDNTKQSMQVFSSNGGVLVFVAFVTQLCSPSNMCGVWRVDTHLYTQSSLSIFTMLGTAVLSSMHSGMVVHS